MLVDRIRIGIAALLTAALSSTVTSSAEPENLKAFPAAGDGMVRYVIALPHKERNEETDFRVELVVGKVLKTDGVNQYRLGATIEAKPLEGWGFTYYEVSKIGPPASTRMAAPPGTAPVEKFVSGQPLLIGYNSRIPIVVYVPEGAEVRFRIWSAEGEPVPAEEG